MSQHFKESSESNKSLSDSWKKKFEILQKIGADKNSFIAATSSPEFKELSFKERNKIMFNTWAFIFGPAYYIRKKMWEKGVIILGATWILASLLTLFEAVIGVPFPAFIYWIPGAVIYSLLADYDYFRQVMNGEKMWGGLPGIFSKRLGIVGFPVIALVVLIFVSPLTPYSTGEMESFMLEDLNGVWREEMDGEIIAISLRGSNKSLNIGGSEMPVSVQSIEPHNDIVNLDVVLPNGQRRIWTFRQFFSEDGSFDWQLTLHDGTQHDLSFVRD